MYLQQMKVPVCEAWHLLRAPSLQGSDLCVKCREGRVLQANGQDPEPGLYVVGWAKRGPTGIIGQ